MFKIPIAVFYCMSGALAVLMLRFMDESKLKPDDRPDYRSPLYYLRGIMGILLAGLLGYIYFIDEPIFRSKLIYFHTGAATPLIVRTLQNRLPSALGFKTKDL